MNVNLYQILEINKNADTQTIKQAYKKLALKYHPDKNSSKDANEIFNHIKIAYDILSSDESKRKYDSLSISQHDTLISVIYNFVKSLIEPETMEKLMQQIFNNDIDVLAYLKPSQTNIPNYDLLKEQIDKRLQNYLDLEHITQCAAKLNAEYTNKQEDMWFYRQDDVTNNNITLQEKNYQLLSSLQNNNESDNYSCVSQAQSHGTNIYCEIKTNLDEIYNSITKKIIVKRQIIENNDIIYKQYEYDIDLNEDQLIFEEQGDNYYDANNNIKFGNLIVNIKCKQHQYFKRVNDYDVLINLPLTLHELFDGFNKTFDYFGSQKIKLVMRNPFGTITSDKKIIKQHNFDGNKLVVVISDIGLPYENNKRGNLIIYLMLIKKVGFNEKIKSI
jgi:DnaJ-class molecular chaperone